MTVELGLTPDSRWECDTETLVRSARDAGFTALGLPAPRADAEAAAALGEYGVRCHELMALVVTEDTAQVLDTARALAAAARVVRAESVLTTFAVPGDAATLALTRRCAALFAEGGARMAVEFSPLGGLGSIVDAQAVVEAVGVERAGMVVDTWHFCHGGSTWEQLERVPLDLIAYVQFTDAPPPESDRMYRETLHRRVMPGDGVLDLGRFASTLLDRGWSGLVSVEVLNAELRRKPVAEFARLAHTTTARYWR